MDINLRQQSSDLIKAAIALTDLGLITCAFYLAYWLRFDGLLGVQEYIWLYYFSAPLILLLLLRHGVLTGFRYQSLRAILKSALVAFGVAGVISSTFLYLSKTADYSRLLFGNYFLLAAIFILLEKIVVKKIFDRQLRFGRMGIRIAMVGFGGKFEDIVTEIKGRPQWGLIPTLIIDPRTTEVREIISKIRDSIVDEVYISCPRGSTEENQIDKLLEGLEMLGLPVRVAFNFDELRDLSISKQCMPDQSIDVCLRQDRKGQASPRRLEYLQAAVECNPDKLLDHSI